jgi:MFS family permease
LFGLSISIIGCIIASTAHSINTLIGAQVLIGLGGSPFVAYTLFAEVAPARFADVKF